MERKCKGCGNILKTEQMLCDYCLRPFSYDADNQASIERGRELLSRGEYSLALKEFTLLRKLTDESELYYYSAICLLEGKRVRHLHNRERIERIVKWLNIAIEKWKNAKYYYFLAYVKYDYYDWCGRKNDPDSQSCLKEARKLGLTSADKREVFEMLKIEKPEEFDDTFCSQSNGY